MSVPAGWYPDPQDPRYQRYWNGTGWTEHLAPAAPVAASAQPVAAAAPADGGWVSRHKGLTITAAVLGALVLLGLIGAATGGGNTPTAAASSSPSAPPTPSPTPSQPPTSTPEDTTPPPSPSPSPEPATPSPTEPAASTPPPEPAGPAAAIVGDGTFTVPDEVKPGTYTAPDATGGCYWARLKGTSGDLEDIAANGNAAGPIVVTILKTDRAFETSGCGDWLAGTPKIVSNTRQVTDGVWAVGVNVAPGTYKTSGVSGCYWARLSNFTGGFEAIIANDNVDGRTTVTIAPGDKGFESSGCGTWKRS